jgi:trimethylamine:corrinoid methyltransferase-like protein
MPNRDETDEGAAREVPRCPSVSPGEYDDLSRFEADSMPSASLTVWNEADCRRVHAATLGVLDECGVEVRNFPRALELFSGAGARVAGTRVRIGPDLVRRALAAAPRT